jgi:MFS family permease
MFFGKVYAHFNVKWIFLSALGIFEVGSILCAAAPSSVVLIVGRAIAGLGATGISTGALLVRASSTSRELEILVIRLTDPLWCPIGRSFLAACLSLNDPSIRP